MGSITCVTPEETEQLGESWTRACQGGEVFALRGPLGAGKTQLVKGMAKGLNYTGEVTSPTFNLVHEYEGGRLTLFHFDLYRLENPEESRRLGLDEYFYGSGICVVEWPDRIPKILPPHTQYWEIEVLSPSQRRISRIQ